MTLVARTRRTDAEPVPSPAAPPPGPAAAGDLTFLGPDRGFTAAGVAVEVVVAAGERHRAAELVHEALAGIEVDDEVGALGCGPIAFAALPFDPAAACRFVVPRSISGLAADGTRWSTTIGPEHAEGHKHDKRDDGHQDDDRDKRDHGDRVRPDLGPTGTTDVLGAALAPSPPPSAFTVTASRSPQAWCATVAEARERIRAGHVDKVVLAREVLVEADQPFDLGALVRRLVSAHPSAYRFSVDGFVGASPELLVSRVGDVVRAQPMAGTTTRSGDPADDARRAAELLASAKDRSEHQLTIDMVLDTLLPFCSYVDSEPLPSVVPVANVQHLATLVEGRLSRPPASVLELVEALHPTPAVCGSPRAAALDLINELECLDRDRYAGPVGWVDGSGNGTWAVGIRSAVVSGSTARLFAGVGVVADSDPERELEETRAKLRPLLEAVLRV